MTRKQCYILLGISEGSSLNEVKHAYRKRAFELHPDLNPAPDASRKFQQLNEAYVLLLGFLEEENNLNAFAQKQSKAYRQQTGRTYRASAQTARAQEKAEAAYTASSQTASASAAGAGQNKEQKAEPFSKAWQASSASRAASTQNANEQKNMSWRTTQSATSEQGIFFNRTDSDSHLSRDEVLSGVLRDPFARRVFEDIYSEIKHSGKSVGKAIQKSGKDIADLFPLKGSRSIINYVKDWLRKQIDDEQTVSVPVHSLRPGMRIRLQIQQGMSGDVQSIEVTIPTDYTPGRPVRLKGLGRKIGPWLGDLYLKIIPKSA